MNIKCNKYNQMMQNLLENLISSRNPELLQKYLQKYLPKDQQNLQRIYNQLSNYTPPSKVIEKQVTVAKQFKKQSKKRTSQTPIQGSIRETKSLILMLRQKGINPVAQDFQNGNKIAERQRQKFLKPLKTNPIAPFLKKGKINTLCQKYDLNKQFYQNPPDGFDITHYGYDPQMAEFIQKRKRLLKSISQKKTNEMEWDTKYKKYQSIESKIKKSQQKSKQFPSLFRASSQQALTKQQVKKQAKDIMERCNSFHKMKNGVKDVNNYFQELQNKILMDDDIDIDGALRTKVNEKGLANEKFDRYNLAYMNYLKQKQDYRSMSRNKKELLKNQIKMRGLVNFNN